VHEIPPELVSRPFTLDQLRALGVSPDIVRGERFRSPYPGVHLTAELDVHRQRDRTRRLDCEALALVAPPQAAFSHETACLLRRLPLPLWSKAEDVDVTVPIGVTPPRVRGVRGHSAQWDDGDVELLGSLRVTSVPRTLCDLAAAGWSALDLVVLADAVLARGRRPSRAPLVARARAWTGRRGAVRLRQALALAEFRVGSPMETRLRLLLRTSGLPRPSVNEPVHDQGGQWVHTPDLSWPRWKVALDYDGAHHFAPAADSPYADSPYGTYPDAGNPRADSPRADSPRDQSRQGEDPQETARRARAVAAQLRRDAQRREALGDEGWIFRIVTHDEVLLHPDVAVDRARSALLAAGARW
jgi:hypothetical protein